MVERSNSFTREEVLDALMTNEYTKVTFYKVNSELRDMVCTLNPDQLARLALEEDLKEMLSVSNIENESEYDLNQIRVFDTEKRGWRSFLLSNLITFESINQ